MEKEVMLVTGAGQISVAIPRRIGHEKRSSWMHPLAPPFLIRGCILCCRDSFAELMLDLVL